jgi:WD40 repeat protein
VGGLSFSENGFYMVSAGGDGAVKAWDLRKLACFATLAVPAPSSSAATPAATAVAFDGSGHYVAAGSAAGVVAVGDAKAAFGAGGAAPLATLARGAGEGAAVSSLAWGPLARSLLVGSASAKAALRVFAVPE